MCSHVVTHGYTLPHVLTDTSRYVFPLSIPADPMSTRAGSRQGILSWREAPCGWDGSVCTELPHELAQGISKGTLSSGMEVAEEPAFKLLPRQRNLL